MLEKTRGSGKKVEGLGVDSYLHSEIANRDSPLSNAVDQADSANNLGRHQSQISGQTVTLWAGFTAGTGDRLLLNIRLGLQPDKVPFLPHAVPRNHHSPSAYLPSYWPSCGTVKTGL